LAVAGVVGTAVAAPSNTIAEVGSKDVNVVFEFTFEGSLEWIDHGADAVALSGINVLERTQVDPGNLGALKINTNAPSWDITMTSKYGGRLYAAGGPTGNMIEDPDCTPSIFDPPCGLVPETNQGVYLKYTKEFLATATADGLHSIIPTGTGTGSPDAQDTVILDVAIGVAREFQPGAARTGLYAAGEEVKPTAVVVPATRIGKAMMLASAPATIKDGTNTPVSFAERFGTDLATGTTTGGANTNLAKIGNIGGVAVTDVTATTVGTALKDTGFKQIASDQYFYINAGIGKDNKSFIEADPTKVFKETLTFKLMAGF